MTWYQKIIKAHKDVTDAVSHGGRLQSDRYFVWMEDGENDLNADNAHANKSMTGTTDLFSRIEFDPWFDQLEQSFDANGISYRLNSVQFEEETGFWHWEWRWEVLR